MRFPNRAWLLLSVVVAFLAGGLLRGAEMRASKPETRREVIAVIDAQLAYFRTGELAEAHGLASSELRAQKPLREFALIVERNYPEVWASTRAEFGIVRDNGRSATLPVQVYSKAGDASYDYTLVREAAGWRIHGVLRRVVTKGKA